MSGQSQNQFFPRSRRTGTPVSAVVQELEERLAVPGKNPEVAATYQQLCRDPAVVLAARYLALSAIANKLNLYSEHGSASGLVQEISEHMNAVDPNKLLASIQHLKSYYPSLYRMNTLAFDTAANTAVDCIHRVAPQDQAVAARPVQDFAQPPVAAWVQSPPPMDFAQPLVTVNHQSTPAGNNRAIIIGGSIVASSIVAGTFFSLGRSNVPPTATAVVSPSAMPSPNNLPTVMASATAPSSPLAIPSVTKTVVPSYSAAPVQTPRLSGDARRQANAQTPKASVIPIPIPTRATNANRSAAGASSDRAATSAPPNTLKIVPPIKSTTANRPSTIGFINDYYAKLKNGQSQSAWQDLTPSLQGDRQANPGGYSGEYAKWWGGLGRSTQVGKVETVKTTAEAAVVQAHCRYGGKSYITEYHLAFDQASQSWKIDRIKKLS
jgi:hypothetical protein